ncbi:hypothetical protein Acsp01_52040 [Actinoplanes sp. NBRC 101535]|nr:hypothetical protein Acsp01_52040 [Actinoplanes sp. NBRC 101535]
MCGGLRPGGWTCGEWAGAVAASGRERGSAGGELAGKGGSPPLRVTGGTGQVLRQAVARDVRPLVRSREFW